MEQSLTGKALVLVGLAPLGGLAIDFLGADIFPTTQLFLWYGIIIFLFGVGIHRE